MKRRIAHKRYKDVIYTTRSRRETNKKKKGGERERERENMTLFV